MDVQTRQHGGVSYLDFLRAMNKHLDPRSYFEIGTNTGDSLACFTCDSVSVDPNFQISGNVMSGRRRCFLFQMTSDEFFSSHQIGQFLPHGPDVVFIDGLHRFEYLLRDFINVERNCHNRSVIFMHDCLPTNGRMAERQPRLVEDEDVSTRGSWAGDVWRIVPALKKYRPDLRVHFLDCPPTGLMVCTNINPASEVLATNYYAIVDEFSAQDLCSYGISNLFDDYPIVNTQALLERPWDLSKLFAIY